MAQFLMRAVSEAPNIAKLNNTLNNKLESIKAEARNGLEIPSFVFLGTEYDEMLESIKGDDIFVAQKWLQVTSFIIKSEMIRLQKGESISEHASPFFEGVITTMLDTLERIEGTASTIASNLWNTLSESLSMILSPNVAAVVKCHKRIAHRSFNFVLQTTNTEHAERLILVIMTWMCSTRSFDSNNDADTVYINQLRTLQRSENDSISAEATTLILNNIQKVMKREPKVLPEFILDHVKLITKEIQLGTVSRFGRILQLIEATFNVCKRSRSDLVLDLVPLWDMFDTIFKQLPALDENTVKQSLALLSRVVSWLGPDLILVNVKSIQQIFSSLFQHPLDLVIAHGNHIQNTLHTMSACCLDFYILMSTQLEDIVKQVNVDIDRDDLSNAAALLGILTELDGPVAGHTVEALIIRLATINRKHWESPKLANAALGLINQHIARGCSSHQKALRIMLIFVQQLRSAIGHSRFADSIIIRIRDLLSPSSDPDVNTEYALYTEELQKYIEMGYPTRNTEEPSHQPTQLASADNNDTTKNKRDDVIDAIKKRLKSMCQPVKQDSATVP
ncbi:hypothetical protein BBOV_II003880 [Babesia bovis T2Bo]|uniref:Uncharacterized protein n=1 Tax=Babesia bovis TaxID=5865 RepID=A7ATT2_BABBO|nr:hypothetical protein BBOV_II003880 [Babesia bovis T2Bo]EDO06343.1 hypothetical protein BBOV_II003880 [Babesia bovis T2Bo]|eukprot:XP_001609911.1 hypothetical protein [Babesia bovis T2Bo]